MIQIKKAGVVIKVSIFMGSKYVSDTVLQIKNTNNLKFCIDSFNSSLSLASHTEGQFVVVVWTRLFKWRPSLSEK